MAVVLVPIVAHDGVGAVASVAIMAGVIVLIMGLAGLGRLFQFVPWPVLEGFTVGIAVTIALQQVPLLLGESKGTGSTVPFPRTVPSGVGGKGRHPPFAGTDLH